MIIYNIGYVQVFESVNANDDFKGKHAGKLMRKARGHLMLNLSRRWLPHQITCAPSESMPKA